MSPAITRVGGVVCTASGVPFYPLDPRPDEIRIEDIAHALSNMCRWTGHVKEFYCPAPDELVLTGDLRWVPAGDLAVGDLLLGFDEELTQRGSGGNRRRRFRPSVVKTACAVKRRLLRLEMSDGSTVRSSAEHPWLVATKQSRNQKWMTTEQIAKDISAGKRRYLHKFVEPWRQETSRDAGWIAGIADGEGYVSISDRKGIQFGMAQNPGLVLDEMTRVMHSLGFTANRYTNVGTASVINLQLRGGWREIARFLGSFRLLSKFVAALVGGEFAKQLSGKVPLQIVRSWDEGDQWVAGIETSTRTYLCNGYGAHNSVAEHSVRVSWELALRHGGNAPLARAGLLHDASEAYLVDVPRPVKHLPMMSPYRDAEALLQSAIARKFGCELEDAADRVRLEVIDDVLLATEWRDLMPSSSATWLRLDTPPLADVIRPWPPSMARAEFLDRFHHLFGAAT
jgi:hypothetical protein